MRGESGLIVASTKKNNSGLDMKRNALAEQEAQWKGQQKQKKKKEKKLGKGRSRIVQKRTDNQFRSIHFFRLVAGEAGCSTSIRTWASRRRWIEGERRRWKKDLSAFLARFFLKGWRRAKANGAKWASKRESDRVRCGNPRAQKLVSDHTWKLQRLTFI